MPIGLVYIETVRSGPSPEGKVEMPTADLAAAVAAIQMELVGVKARMQERDAENDSLRETIVSLTHENQLLVGCWAHCRRRFFEAAICKYPVGVQGLMRIRAIYAADDAFRGLAPAKRKLMRAEHLRPLLESFFDWVKQARVVAEGRNLATNALGYAFNQEKELMRVLDDGRLALDNTRSERSLRKIVVGRKNWMFYGSDAHAQSAAAAFSIIASCRLHSLDPEQYLDEVLRVLPYWPKERYLELAPNNWAATRVKLRSDELDAPLCSFTVPAACFGEARPARAGLARQMGLVERLRCSAPASGTGTTGGSLRARRMAWRASKSTV